MSALLEGEWGGHSMQSRQPAWKHRSKSGRTCSGYREAPGNDWALMGSHLYAEPDRKREGHDDEEQGCEDKKPLTGP